MILIGSRSKIISLSDNKVRNDTFEHVFHHRPFIVRCNRSDASSLMDCFQNDNKDKMERIRELFGKIEVCPSAYDTAWVAMVPSRDNPKQQPCYPQCLDWILQNQRKDGSWGLNPTHPGLVKDSLSSTLACLLALSKWEVGDKLVQRGLDFIGKHCWSIDEKGQVSPLGFDIIFPSMVKQAEDLNLNVPLERGLVNVLLQRRDSTIERMSGRSDIKECISNLAYFAEGLCELCQWEEVMTHQRKNGSFFSSPATTAAALINHSHDEKCMEYINSILKQHKNWVPTIYPATIHTRLQMVDTLQNLGVDRHFKTEIKSVLDETYRLWEQKDEEIYSDVASCAMAFRLLRMGSYEVSSEELARFIEEEHFINSLSNAQFTSDAAVLELLKASQFVVDEKDHILDEISTRTRTFIQDELLNRNTLNMMSHNEVERSLRNINASLRRAENRRYIESYDTNAFKILKSAYRSPNIYNKDFLLLSVHDFCLCQTVQREEIQELKRWSEDCKLHQVGLSSKYIYTCYLPISSFLFEPEFSNARTEFAKYGLLVTVIDDFFDNLVSPQELLNLIELVKAWNRYSIIGFISERVEIVFLAIYKTVNESAAKAEIIQGRCVKDHLINLNLEVLNSMMSEVNWWIEETTPSQEEYLSTACDSIAVKLLLFTSQYLLGPKLSEDIIESAELSEICKCTAMVCRLFNDIQSYQKEKEERSSNMIKVLMTQRRGATTEEEAVIQVHELIKENRRKLLRMVLGKKGSKLPQVCKNLFWSTSKIATFLYSSRDEFRSPEELNRNINTLYYEPLKLSPEQAHEIYRD